MTTVPFRNDSGKPIPAYTNIADGIHHDGAGLVYRGAPPEPVARPPSASEWFAWLFRGRLSSLRGLAAVGFIGASFVGSWPLVLYWCRTRGERYAVWIVVNVLLWPVTLWAVHLHGMNAKVDMSGYDPNGEPWYKRRRAFPKPGTPEWGKMNQERAELIRRKVRGIATEGQLVRLAYLQAESLKALAGDRI